MRLSKSQIVNWDLKICSWYLNPWHTRVIVLLKPTKSLVDWCLSWFKQFISHAGVALPFDVTYHCYGCRPYVSWDADIAGACQEYQCVCLLLELDSLWCGHITKSRPGIMPLRHRRVGSTEKQYLDCLCDVVGVVVGVFLLKKYHSQHPNYYGGDLRKKGGFFLCVLQRCTHHKRYTEIHHFAAHAYLGGGD